MTLIGGGAKLVGSVSGKRPGTGVQVALNGDKLESWGLGVSLRWKTDTVEVSIRSRSEIEALLADERSSAKMANWKCWPAP